MELHKLEKDEIKSYPLDRLKELEWDIRKEMAMNRMKVFAKDKEAAGKTKRMRKNLARVLTMKTQYMKNQATKKK